MAFEPTWYAPTTRCGGGLFFDGNGGGTVPQDRENDKIRRVQFEAR
jgi:hypothetical protein